MSSNWSRIILWSFQAYLCHKFTIQISPKPQKKTQNARSSFSAFPRGNLFFFFFDFFCIFGTPQAPQRMRPPRVLRAPQGSAAWFLGPPPERKGCPIPQEPRASFRIKDPERKGKVPKRKVSQGGSINKLINRLLIH